MPFGLIISVMCHAALLGWAYISMRSVQELPHEDTPAISAEIITPSEFLRLKQGSEESKNLETKAKEEPKPDDSKNDTKKPENAAPPPPPPPQEVAKVEEPPPPPEPPKPAEPDPIAKKMEEPPPPPTPEPGPTPDEQKLLQQKIEEEHKAEEEAKKKAEAEAKKKAEEEAKKKKLEEERKRKIAEVKKKAEEAKKKFDANKIANLLNKAPDDAQPKANIDKDPTKKGQQAAGTSHTATATGKEAGTATGNDTVLSAREQDLLKGMIKSQLANCWRLPGAGGGAEIPPVKLRWSLNPDGSLNGEPGVMSAPNDTLGNAAAEAALRAVRTCQPFRLPPDSYEGWKDIEWVFDPRQML